MAGTGSGSSPSVPSVRAWRTAFLTLRDETLTLPPRSSVAQMLHNLIFSHAHALTSAVPEIPSHEVSLGERNCFPRIFFLLFSFSLLLPLFHCLKYLARFCRTFCFCSSWLPLLLPMKKNWSMSLCKHHAWYQFITIKYAWKMMLVSVMH